MHVSTGGAVLQPASALTTPGDTLPHFPSPVLQPVTQPPVHSQRRPSPTRLLRWRSSSAAQNPSACSFGPASGFRLPRLQRWGGRAAGHAPQAVPAGSRLCGAGALTGERVSRWPPLSVPAAVSGADGSAEGRGVGRKLRGGLGADPGLRGLLATHTRFPLSHPLFSPILKQQLTGE